MNSKLSIIANSLTFCYQLFINHYFSKINISSIEMMIFVCFLFRNPKSHMLFDENESGYKCCTPYLYDSVFDSIKSVIIDIKVFNLLRQFY